MRNAAHDSVCACSIDEVVDAVLHRYAEAADIGEGLAERAMPYVRVEAWSPPGEVVVANPTSRPRSGLVEVRVAGESAPPGTQLLRGHESDVLVAEGAASLVVPAVQQVDWLAKVEGFTVDRPGRRGAAGPPARRARARWSPRTCGRRSTPSAQGPLRLTVHRRPEVKVLRTGRGPRLRLDDLAARRRGRR